MTIAYNSISLSSPTEYSKLMDRYKILDSRMVGTTPIMVAAKVVVDQAVTAPPILATFYTGLRS